MGCRFAGGCIGASGWRPGLRSRCRCVELVAGGISGVGDRFVVAVGGYVIAVDSLVGRAVMCVIGVGSLAAAGVVGVGRLVAGVVEWQGEEDRSAVVAVE